MPLGEGRGEGPASVGQSPDVPPSPAGRGPGSGPSPRRAAPWILGPIAPDFNPIAPESFRHVDSRRERTTRVDASWSDPHAVRREVIPGHDPPRIAPCRP